MIPQENITTIKRLGIESGTVGIWCSPQRPSVIIEFMDEESYAGMDVDFILEEITLGEMCFIKEARVIGDVNLENIKTSAEVEKAKKLLGEEVKKMKPEFITKAKAYVKEIKERAGIPVQLIEEIQGEPGVMTEYDENMWHAGETLRGIDDDY